MAENIKVYESPVWGGGSTGIFPFQIIVEHAEKEQKDGSIRHEVAVKRIEYRKAQNLELHEERFLTSSFWTERKN